MGLDMTITKAWHVKRNPEKKWRYDYEIAPKFDFEIENEIPDVNELYWRKFWDLHREIWWHHSNDLDEDNLDNGVDIILTKEDMEEILHTVTHIPDYFEKFQHLGELAYILYYWDEYAAQGVKWIYNGNY